MGFSCIPYRIPKSLGDVATFGRRSPSTNSKRYNYGPLSCDVVASSVQPAPRAIGVVRVVVQGVNVGGKRMFSPHPFVRVGMKGREERKALWDQTHSPECFGESSYILVCSLFEDLGFEVLCSRRARRPSVLGRASLPLAMLERDAKRIGEEVEVVKGGKSIGTILANLFYYPLVSASESVGDSEKGRGSESATGIVTLQIHEASGFGWETYSQKARALAVRLSLGWSEPPLYQTGPSYFVDPAYWKSTFEFLCFDRRETTVVAKVMEFDADSERMGRRTRRNFKGRSRRSGSGVFGHMAVLLGDLLLAQGEGREWWPLSGSRDGRLRMTAEWRPVEMDAGV